MVKSKKSKIVSCTKTPKRNTRDRKLLLIERTRSLAESCKYLYSVRLEHQNSKALGELRALLKPSEFFCGNKNLLRVALGKTPATEIKEGASDFVQKLGGNRGVLFSNAAPDEIMKTCESYRPPAYAQAGDVAKTSLVLPEGKLDPEIFSPALEAPLRKLGMPTKLNNAIIELCGAYVVTEAGRPLSPENSKVLRLLRMKHGTFKASVESYWVDGKVCQV